MGKLRVTVLRGTNLIAADVGGTSDPYVILRVGKQNHKTHTINKTLNPTWNQQFTFDIHDPHLEVLILEVYDHDLIGHDDSLGTAAVPLEQLVCGLTSVHEVPLLGGSSKHINNGKVLLELTAVDFGAHGQPPAAASTAPAGQPPPASAHQPGYPPASAGYPPASSGYQSGFPSPQSFGYPPQGYPPDAYPPPQGYPPQGYPPQGYPPQGYPPQGYPPQGYPPQGYPPPGAYPPQGYPPPGAYPPQGYPPPGAYPQSSAPGYGSQSPAQQPYPPQQQQPPHPPAGGFSPTHPAAPAHLTAVTTPTPTLALNLDNAYAHGAKHGLAPEQCGAAYERFVALDRDHNGKLTEDELHSVMADLEGRRMAPGLLKRLTSMYFSEFDRDHSGSVNFWEFLELYSRVLKH